MNDYSGDTLILIRTGEVTSLVDSVRETLDSIRRGDWSEGLADGSRSASADGIVADPLGSLSSSGFGWATELFSPLQQAMDQLAGDPGEIEVFCQTWATVGNEVSIRGRALRDTVAEDGANWNSEAVTAYRGATDTESTAVESAGDSFQGIAEAAQQGALAVDAVRQDVTVLVNVAVTRALPLLAQAMNPITLAAAIVGLIELVAEYAPQILKLLGDLANVMSSLGSLIGQLLPIISQALGLITAIGSAMSSAIGTTSADTPADQDKSPEDETEDGHEDCAPQEDPQESKV